MLLPVDITRVRQVRQDLRKETPKKFPLLLFNITRVRQVRQDLRIEAPKKISYVCCFIHKLGEPGETSSQKRDPKKIPAFAG